MNKPIFLFLLLTMVQHTTILAANLPFAIYTVELKSYPKQQSFDATVEAIRRATISSETSGRISEINFDVDDFVKKDSILIRITAAATRARLTGVEANVNEAQAQHEIAVTEFNRIKDVFSQKLVSKSAYDKAETELKAAAERVTAAKAKVKEVLEQLKYKVVKAPYSGIVAERHVELGEMAKVGQPLMSGYSLNELRAVTYVPQSVIKPIREAKSARIILTNNPEEDLHSSQITVYPDASADSHTYKVRVKLPTVPKGIYPGHFIKVMFTTGVEKSIRVPNKAIVQRGELQALYVVTKKSGTTNTESNDIVSLRQVRLGNRHEDGMTDILAGVFPGESVALDPVSAGIYLKEHSLKEQSQKTSSD